MTVRQRNPGPHAVSVPTLSAEVQPGEIVDWPDPISGFEPVEDDTEPAETPADSSSEQGRTYELDAPDGDDSSPAPVASPDTPLPAASRRIGAKNKAAADAVAETPEA